MAATGTTHLTPAGGAPTASTLVGVEALALPERLMRIEATAVLD